MSESKTQEKTNTSTTKKVLKIVLNVILWIFLVFAAVTMVFAFLSSANDYGVPMFGDKVLLNVQSDSMSPTFNAGDMLIGTVLTDEDKANLKENDIITFYVDLNGDNVKELNTHRIVEVGESSGVKYYVTKGDNNLATDTYRVYDRDILATWKDGDGKIGGLGGFLSFLQSSTGFLIVIVIPLAIFFIYELVSFILLIIRIKNGDKKKISPEEEAIRERLYAEYLVKQQEEKEAKEKLNTESSTDQSED